MTTEGAGGGRYANVQGGLLIHILRVTDGESGPENFASRLSISV